MRTLSVQDRLRLARMANISEQYLYQCTTGRRSMEAGEAVRVESDTSQELRRWDLRPNDWHRIWPELIGTDGAPAVKEAA